MCDMQLREPNFRYLCLRVKVTPVMKTNGGMQIARGTNCLRMYCLLTIAIPLCELEILVTSSLAYMSILPVSYLL